MKIFISADIEGIASTAKWSETSPSDKEYPYHCDEMTREVVSACNAAMAAGADEIVIKDAHGYATNIDVKQLPECASIIRGWEGHPYMMVQGIDGSFDAVMFIGYHSEAGSPGNPMSHTMTRRTQHLKINGEYASEFYIYSMCAAREGVPTVYLSGDKALCESSTKRYPWLISTPVKEGFGESLLCMSPAKAQKRIYEDAFKALKQDLKSIPIPEFAKKYTVEVEYKEHADAAKMAYFPGLHRMDSHTVGFEATDFFEMVKTLRYVM